MPPVPFCSECGEQLNDYFDVEMGLCGDCQLDVGFDPDKDSDEDSWTNEGGATL